MVSGVKAQVLSKLLRSAYYSCKSLKINKRAFTRFLPFWPRSGLDPSEAARKVASLILLTSTYLLSLFSAFERSDLYASRFVCSQGYAPMG